MGNKQHILISLDARHAENIFSKQKLVELRRRFMNVEIGTVAWVYVKLPIGSIVGHVKIASICHAQPDVLWLKYGQVSGLSKDEFFSYFKEVENGIALVLEDPEMLKRSIPLKSLKEISNNFHPPQFFTYLYEEDPLLSAVSEQS